MGSYDVGIAGSAAAWQLATRGEDVVLLERFEAGHPNGASHGASRIFRPTVTGGVDHGGDPYPQELADGLAASGVRHSWRTPDEAAERRPGLRFDTRALLHPDSGRLHADRSVAALQAAAEKAGAIVRQSTPVTSIEVLGDDEVLVHTDSGSCRTLPDPRSAFARSFGGTP